MRTTDFFDFDAATSALKKEGAYIQNIAVDESRAHNARITLRKQDDGAIKVKADAATKDFVPLVDPKVTHTRTCKYSKQLPRVVGQLAAMTAKEADRLCEPAKQVKDTLHTYITNALIAATSGMTGDDFPNAPRSFAKDQTFLTHEIAPRMDKIGADAICDADMELIASEIVEHAMESRRGKKTADGAKLPKERAKVIQGVRGRIRRCGIIYHKARETHPEAGLPDVQFPNLPSQKIPQEEQFKEFALEIRVKTNRILHRLYDAGITLAGAGIMAQTGGLRVAEAAGLQECSVLSLAGDACDTILVDGQEDRGSRIDYPKTDAGNRVEPTTEEARTLLCQRMKELEVSGILQDHPDGKVPLFGPADQPLTYPRSEKLSELLKAVMELAGCDEAYLTAAQQEIDPTKKDPAPLRAHQLRHDCFSRWINECGIPQAYADAIGGHAGKDDNKKDMVTEDTIRWLQMMLRRVPFDIDLAQDPAYKPIVCNPDEQISVPDGAAILLEAAEDGVYRIDIGSREPYDAIRITAPAGRLNAEAVTLHHDAFRPGVDAESVIGPRIPPEDLEKWKKEADEIDIGPLIQKYKRPGTTGTGQDNTGGGMT